MTDYRSSSQSTVKQAATCYVILMTFTYLCGWGLNLGLHILGSVVNHALPVLHLQGKFVKDFACEGHWGSNTGKASTGLEGY